MTTPAQGQQQPPQRGATAAAAAAGLIPALAPIGAGAGMVALGAGGALGAEAAAAIVEAAVDALRGHARARVGQQAPELRQALEQAFPERAADELDPIVREELRRERAFQHKMEKRLRRDLPKALQIEAADERRDRVQAILLREQRYVGMRVQAMHDRAIARAEHLAVKDASPRGAYWWLSPDVQEHTIDCLALGHKFWPWTFLTEAHPPLHPGCRCELLTLEEAVQRGYMTEEQVPDPAKALETGRDLLADARKLLEQVTAHELASWVAELREGEAEARLSAIARRFPSVDYGELWWDAAAGRVFYDLGDADGHQRDVVARLFADVPGVREVEIGDESGRPEGEGWARLDTNPLNPIEEARWERRFARGTKEGGRFMPRRGGVSHAIRREARRLLDDFLPQLPRTPAERRLERHGRWRDLNGRRTFVPEARHFERTIGGATFRSPPGTTEVRRLPAPGAPQEPGLYVGRGNLPVVDKLFRRRAQAIDRARELAARAADDPRPGLVPVKVGAQSEATDAALRLAGYAETSLRPTPAGTEIGYVAPDGASRLRVVYSGMGNVATAEWDVRPPPEPAPLLDRAPRSWGEFTAEVDSIARHTALAHGRHAFLERIEVSDEFADHAAETFQNGTMQLGEDFRPSVEALVAARAKGAPGDDVLRNGWAAVQSSTHEAMHAATVYDADADPADIALEEALAEEVSHLEAVKALRRRGEQDLLDWRADHPLDYKSAGTYQDVRSSLADLLDRGAVPADDREALLRRLLLDTAPSARVPALAEATHQAAAAVRRALEHPPPAPRDFLPILAPPLEPTHRPSGLRWRGQDLQPGDLLRVAGDGTPARPAALLAVDETAGRPLAEVAYTDTGDVEYAVPASRIAGATPTPPRPAGSVAADTGTGIHEGDRVAWEGGEGVVSRILAPGPAWQLDVRTGAGRAYLTPSRAPGLESLGPEAGVRDGGGTLGRGNPPTLEQLAAERALFDAPPRAPRAALRDLVPTQRPARRRAEPTRGGPLRTRGRADGRLDVVGRDSQRLYAAREAGLTHAPVRRNEDSASYRGGHRAPWRSDESAGSSLDDPTSAFGGDDIYGPNGLRYYGSGGPAPHQDPETQAWARKALRADKESLAAITAARGKPDKLVTVYRAVPEGTEKINPGDWVTPSRTYAEIHGESNLEAPGGGYDEPSRFKILSAEVRAGDLFTDGDLNEWGWSPERGRRTEALSATEPQGRGSGVAAVPASWPERGLDFADRWDALPDDAPVWLFHATDPATAARMAAEGVDPAGKPMSLGRSRYEAGQYAEFQPGAGLGAGLSVGYEPWSVSGYGRAMVAVRVRKGDVEPSPEQRELGAARPQEALRVNDAMVRAPIPARDVRLLELGGREPTRAVLAQLEPGRANEPTTPLPRDDGSVAGRHQKAVSRVKALRSKWAELDRDLLPYTGRPNDPAARAIIDEQKATLRELHHAHLDEGGPEGIGQPGGPRDVVIVGAGPAGLSAAIGGGTEGLDTLLLDAEPNPGGQAWHSSRIENVLGFPAGVTGRDLAMIGLDQVERTGAQTRFSTRVERMDYDPATGLKHLSLADGSTVAARTVVIAGGVLFRKMDFPGSDAKGVVYGDSTELKKRAAGGPVVIVGGANSAGQAAVDAARAGEVTLVVRRGSIRDTMSPYLADQLEGDPRVTIVARAELASANVDEAGAMSSVTLKDGRELPARALGLFIGSAPNADWAGVERDDDGFVTVGHGDALETTMPGVYAAGDARSGGLKRIASASGDGAAAISMTHAFLDAMRSGEVPVHKLREADDVPEEEWDAFDRWLERVWEYDREQPWTGADEPPTSRAALEESWRDWLHPHDRLGRWARTHRVELGVDRQEGPGNLRPHHQPPVFRFEDTLAHPERSPRAKEYGIEPGRRNLPAVGSWQDAPAHMPQVPRGRANQALDAASAAAKEQGVDVRLAFEPGDASPAHPNRAEFRMRAAAAILAAHAEVKDAVLHVKDEPGRRKEILAKITQGDVGRAFAEYSRTPVADLEILSRVLVQKHPVSGQANTQLQTRALEMGSTSVTGDFRHELGHALRAAFGGAGGPGKHTPLTDYVAAQHAETMKRAAASKAAGLPKPQTHEEWETKIGVVDPRGLDSWDEDFAEQYRGYHKAVYQSANPQAPDHNAKALETYRERFPAWARLWDAWYTAQLAGRREIAKGRRNEPLEPSLVDPDRLYGGETIADPEGNRWRVSNVRVKRKGKKETVTRADLTPTAGGGKSRRDVPAAELARHTFVEGPAFKLQGWKPKPPKPKVDDTGTVTLGDLAGGTQGARFGEGGGSTYVVKTYSGDADRVATELLSNAVYRRLGVAVPEAVVLHFDGQPAVGSRMVAGELRRWKEPSAALGEGFMADALLANWDVVGLDQDNVLWDGEEPIRVDQGGTLEYRAQGGGKPFGPEPSEVWTMAGPKGQAFGAMALTPGAKHEGARRIAERLDAATIDDLVDAAPFKDHAMRERVRENLKARVDWMRRYANGEVGEPRPAEGEGARALLEHGQRHLQLTPEQAVALEGFVQGWAQAANAQLRAGGPVDNAARFVVREMDSLLRAQRSPDDLYVYVAVPGEPPAGATMHERGYLLGSLEEAPAREAAGVGGTVLRLLVPKGSPAVLVPALADQLEGEPPPQPQVVLGRGLRARVATSAGGRAEGALL